MSIACKVFSLLIPSSCSRFHKYVEYKSNDLDHLVDDIAKMIKHARTNMIPYCAIYVFIHELGWSEPF